MKSLFFIIIIALRTSNSIAQVTPDNVIIKMKYKQLDRIRFSEVCRGIVIHPRVVMTAAECVDGLLPTELRVENSWHRVFSDVLNITIHPEYIEDNGSNNFAILIMDKIIIMRDSIVCLSSEMFLKNADLKQCSVKRITTKLDFRIFDGDDYELTCKSIKEKPPNIFKSREVEMMICESSSKNSQCFTYYFAHYTLKKVCNKYESDIESIHQHTSFVYDVAPWIQNEVQKYINGVPKEEL